MAAYPTSLPCFLREGSHAAVENLSNSQRQNGEIYGRKKFPSVPEIFSCSLKVTAAEFLIWENFVKVTLDYTDSFSAPIITSSTQNNFTNGKPTVLTNVKLVSSAYSRKMINADSWVLSNIQLRTV